MNHGGKDLKKLIKSRRGVAIELAIGVMFTMIAFTIMLLSTAGLQNSHRNQDYKEFNERIEINNVGEFVVEQYNSNANNYPEGENIEIKIEGESTGYYVFHSESNKFEIYRGDFTDHSSSSELVLTIIMNGNTITSWK